MARNLLRENNQTDLLGAGLAGVGQGLTLGFGDELAAGLAAGVKAPFSAKTIPEIYNEQLEIERGNLAASREQHPVAAIGGEIVGGAVQGGVVANAGRNLLKKAPNLLRLTAFGAVEGGLYGAGSSEEGERLGGALQGTALGAAMTPVGVGVARLGAKGVSAIAKPFWRAASNTPTRQAERAVREAMNLENLGPLSVQERLTSLGPRGTLADIGESTLSVAQAAAGQGKGARTIAGNFLNTRQQGQRNSLLRAAGIDDDFDIGQFRRSFQSFMNGRITKADPLYEQAYASPLNLSSREMRVIMERPSVARAFRQANTILKDAGGGRGSGNLRLVQAAKENLDDQIGVALRQGRRNAASRIIQNKNDMLSIVDQQVPSYAEARQIFSGEASLKDSATLGRNLLSSRVDLDDMHVAVEAMTEGERHAFRLGTIRGLVDKLDAAPDNRNQAQKLVESPRAREILGLIFPNADDFDNFINTAQAESVFSNTRNNVMGGSQTFQRFQAGNDLNRSMGIMGAAASGGDPIATGISVLRHIGIGEASPEALQSVAELLFSNKIPQRQLNRITSRGVLSQIPEITKQGAIAGGGVAGVAGLLQQQ